MVVDRPVEAGALREGDVITYATTDEVSGEQILITHRIVEVRPGPTFITQGDANEEPDTRPVEASQVRGEVWYSIPYVGSARNFLLAQGAGLIIAGAAGLVLAVWLLLYALRPDPAPAAEAEPADSGEPGRHRARTGAGVAALVGLLATGSQFVPHQPGTFASFSDQQTVQFQVTVGTGSSAAEVADSETAAEPTVAPAEKTADRGTPPVETPVTSPPADETTDSAPPVDETADSATPAVETTATAPPVEETADSAGPAPETATPTEAPAPDN
jgi:hypothetical protein